MNNETTNSSAPVSYQQGGAKKSKGLLVTTIIFAITTLGFGGAFAWAMLRNANSDNAADKTSTSCAVTEEEVSAAEEGTVGEIVANYDTEMEVKGLVEELNKYLGTTGKTVSAPVLTYDAGRVLKEVEKDKLYTRVGKSFGLTYMLKDVNLTSEYSNAFDTFLGQKGFVKNPDFTDDYNIYYEKDNIRCEASASTIPVSINCSNLEWAKYEDTTLVKNLYNAYSSSEGAIDGYVVIVADSKKIETSKNGKFETIQVAISGLKSIGGAAGLFYREVGSDSWTYYKSTQAPLPCDGFTGDAREAFAGMKCVTNGGYDIGTVGGE